MATRQVKGIKLSRSAGASCLLAAALFAQQPELIIIKETGPRSRRVNVAVLCDGYTAQEKDKCVGDMKFFSNAVVSKDPPLQLYAEYFNIYGIFAASKESGADQNGVMKDTYFDAAYSPTLARLLTISTTKAMAAIRLVLPEADMQFCVVNSEAYGGSGGQVAVANRTTPAIVAHEVGHSFAKLGDEYDYAGASPWEAPNTTQQTVRERVKWTPWITPATPVPTPETAPYAELMGLFEGAAYNATGWYRPKQNCRMKANGIPFCSVCAEAYILTTYDKISPVDSVFPPNGAVIAFRSEPVTLTVSPMKPSSYALKIQWQVDGVSQAGATAPTFSQALAQGRHRVSAVVSDTTGLVRMDPLRLLSDTAAWEVDVSGVIGTLSGGPGGMGFSVVMADRQGLLFRLPNPGRYRVQVFTAGGQSLRNESGTGKAGLNALVWEAKAPLSPGPYLVVVEYQGRTASQWRNIP